MKQLPKPFSIREREKKIIIDYRKEIVQKEREELSRENTRQTREITQEKRLVRNNYKPMTDEEILQARRKIGLI